MLSGVDGRRHAGEVACAVECGNCGVGKSERAERGGVVGVGGEGAVGEVVVMRRAQQEDLFPVGAGRL